MIAGASGKRLRWHYALNQKLKVDHAAALWLLSVKNTIGQNFDEIVMMGEVPTLAFINGFYSEYGYISIYHMYISNILCSNSNSFTLQKLVKADVNVIPKSLKPGINSL